MPMTKTRQSHKAPVVARVIVRGIEAGPMYRTVIPVIFGLFTASRVAY